jgi:hypothetical protein
MRQAMFDEKKYSDILNNKLLNIKLNKLNEDLKYLKLAYPNDVDGIDIPGQHNLDKWVATLKDVYVRNLQQKVPWGNAIETCTAGWNPIEKLDFNNWVNFYQQGNHLKYKRANHYLNDEVDENESPVMPGYMVPNAFNNSNIEDRVREARSYATEQVESDESNKSLQKHKKKIVSRLDSIEKLLRDEEGYSLTEKENDSLIEAIHNLKKKVYNLRKKTSNLFYQDLIVREANILAKNGLYKAASLLYAVAQASPSPAPPSPGSPPATGGTEDAAGAPSVGAPSIPGSAPAAPVAPQGQAMGRPAMGVARLSGGPKG